ncbi:uncharacterized protein LOC116287225 [Actinia tenebrosa]|uniref:Uncharacterized protein LOC116287225 n=1 Tax=Actinia tenebrosa TaxID=6105 RepID=A0A6P8GZY6_ACTTE|nr:uncharacterized protein LOC116287225 [Actinia tenebrosa]
MLCGFCQKHKHTRWRKKKENVAKNTILYPLLACGSFLLPTTTLKDKECVICCHLDVSSTVYNKSDVAMPTDGLAQHMDKDDCALQNLNLSNCCLGNQDMEPLTDRHCFKDVLQTLDLSCNYIENDATDLLSRLVSHSQTLINLSISGNPGIDSGFLQLFLDAHRTSSSAIHQSMSL